MKKGRLKTLNQDFQTTFLYPARQMFAQLSQSRRRNLHPAVIRSARAFGANPSDVLRRVFDVARFAVNAVGGVDLQARTALLFDDFVHTGRTIARFGRSVFFVVHVYHRLRIFQHQMVGLIFFVREIGEEDAA